MMEMGISTSVPAWVELFITESQRWQLDGAITILDDFEYQLKVHWKMGIKASSRSCMVANGNASIPHEPDKWPIVDAFPVLGHVIQPTGSIRVCWSNARSAMWRSFWANPGAKDAKHLTVAARLSLLQRAVVPQLSFRCSRWPPQHQIAFELDSLQQKMTASILRLPRFEGEETESYVRRRGRIARSFCAESGQWSLYWFKGAVRWDEHLQRPVNDHSWSSRLRVYHGKEWLMTRRAQFAPSTASRNSPASAHAGRTDTRSCRGRVLPRWHDAVDYAKSMLSE